MMNLITETLTFCQFSWYIQQN